MAAIPLHLASARGGDGGNWDRMEVGETGPVRLVERSATKCVEVFRMPESQSHKQYKNAAAGKTGQTEVPLPSGAVLDALSSSGIATEVERGDSAGITKSVASLKEALKEGIARKTRLSVPQSNMDAAFEEMRRQGLGGELTNLSRTVKRQVPKRRT